MMYITKTPEGMRKLEADASKCKNDMMYYLICAAQTNAEDTCSELAMRYHDDPEAYDAKYNEMFWSSLEFLLGERDYLKPLVVKWFERRGIVG
jgi:hypothetical protein